jgi:hypothetical protein
MDLKNTYDSYNFGKNNIEEFIIKCRNFDKNPFNIRDIIRKLLENTDYISYNIFISKLNEIIEEYIKYHRKNYNETGIARPIFISNYLTSDGLSQYYKNKSNVWIYDYVLNYLNTKYAGEFEIKSINGLFNLRFDDIISEFGKTFNENDTIIIVDDCIYTGNQMGTKLRLLNREIKKYFKFYLLIPYGSEYAKRQIEFDFNQGYGSGYGYGCGSKRKINDEKKDERLYFSPNMHMIKTISEILNDDRFYLSDYYPSNMLDVDRSCLIYFDHKLPDIYSVPTIIYSGVVASPKNAQILSSLPSGIEINTEDIQKLDIVPIINNCDKYNKQNGIGLMSPKCPYPPYKEGFDDFIRKIQELNIQREQSDMVSGGMGRSVSKKRLLKSSKK